MSTTRGPETGVGGTVTLTVRESAADAVGPSTDDFLSDPPTVEVIEWTIYGKPVYRCEIRLAHGTDGFSVYAPSLPGVASQGDTPTAAISNIQEALLGAIESYLERGIRIPWQTDIEPRSKKERSLWIVVYA